MEKISPKRLLQEQQVILRSVNEEEQTGLSVEQWAFCTQTSPHFLLSIYRVSDDAMQTSEIRRNNSMTVKAIILLFFLLNKKFTACCLHAMRDDVDEFCEYAYANRVLFIEKKKRHLFPAIVIPRDANPQSTVNSVVSFCLFQEVLPLLLHNHSKDYCIKSYCLFRPTCTRLLFSACS